VDRLGDTRYVAQGGDVGAYVADAMGRQAPEGLLGIHLNVLTAAVALKDQLPAKSEEERAAHDALTTFLTDGFAIVLEQSTRPQTIGYSLLDSPVGLAAWMLDHDTDSYYKISRAFVDGEPAGNLTRDNIVDNITLYWLTGTGASAARWPSKELVDDRSQGVQLATMKELARYLTTEYDWRKCEARLNALPQFTTEIDGVDIRFIHVKSPHEDALPLIMTHGWPGSIIELLETVGPLTDPTAHGGDAEDAFHLVLPSIPGYGFSGEPTELGWDAARIGQAWAELMRRIGY